jgi:hypothetical protein
LAWRFGILVQLASWVSFVSAVSGLDPTAALRSNLWLGFLLLGGAGVLMALMFRGHDAASSGAEDRARARFGRLASGFIIVAAVWLLLGLWVEAWLRLSGGQRATVLVGTALVLAFGLQLLGKRAAWRLPDLLAGAVALVAGLVFAGLMLERMDWHNVASYPYLRFGDLLRDGPLLGGLLLSGGALVSALAFKRRALTTGSDSMRAPATWFLLAVFWFCGFALNGLAHAVAYLSGSAEGGTLWHTISFWAAYGIGLTSSTLAWVWLALRWKFLEPRTTLQSFWPILSWAGGAVFLLQATQQLQWARGASLEPSPLSFGDTLRALLGSPFLGALILCGISAYAMRRMTQAARESRDWRLAFGLSWYLLLLDPLAQFVVNSLVSVLPADLPWQPRYPDTMLLLVAASGAGFIGWAVRRRRLDLRWLAIPAFVLQAVVSAAVLVLLYSRGELPRLATGIALVGCWLAVAWGLREWQRQSWPLGPKTLQLMHFGRVIAPWLMLMPVVSLNLASWIWGDVPPRSGWLLRGQWPDYIASWLGILSLLLLLRQARQRGWPVQPLQTWYQHALIPLATLWGVLLAIYWNLRQDGSMAPLPYLPLLNPLDLTSGFVALLVAKVWQANRAQMSATLQLFAQRSTLALVFAWFNLMLLRTAAQYLSLRYRFDDLYASQFVQVMLSIVWTLSAFFLMRFAASRVSQPLYRVGMTLLFVVVVKLLVVDFGQVQGGARVISFIGVGGLFLVIAILAPFKRATEAKPITEQA